MTKKPVEKPEEGLEEMVKDKDMKKFLRYAKVNGVDPVGMLSLAKASVQGNASKKKVYTVGKKHTRIGYFGDTHIGNIHYDQQLMRFALQQFDKQKVDIVLHGGDVVDGWYQNRPQQVFESDAIGFDRQLAKAVKELSHIKQPFYFITANHEYNTYMRGAGVELGNVLEDRLRERGVKAHFLGNGEGDVRLPTGTKIKLFHPDGGTAYAISYRPQKVAESFEGGHKPQIMIIGHFHKAEYLFYRNIHIYQGGTLCGQTKFMRGRNIPAHKGFWILDVYSSKTGNVDKIVSQFFPAYY